MTDKAPAVPANPLMTVDELLHRTGTTDERLDNIVAACDLMVSILDEMARTLGEHGRALNEAAKVVNAHSDAFDAMYRLQEERNPNRIITL